MIYCWLCIWLIADTVKHKDALHRDEKVCQNGSRSCHHWTTLNQLEHDLSNTHTHPVELECLPKHYFELCLKKRSHYEDK